MNTDRDLELVLRVHFDNVADPTVLDGQVESVLAHTGRLRQHPAWLVALRSHPMSTTTRSLGRPMPAVAWVVLIAVLLLAVLAVGLTAGGWRLPTTPPVNGPIAYGRFDPAVDDTIIHIVRPDGSEDHVLVAGPHECPQFSPDGRKVALVVMDRSTLVAFGVVDIDGSDLQRLPDPVGTVTLGCSTWSPDGQRLASEGFNDIDASVAGIFLADASDGGDLERLTTNGTGGTDIPGDFSPDGRQLAFLRGGPRDTPGVVMIVDVESGATRALTGLDGIPSWSLDSQWLVTVEGDHLVTFRPDGSGARPIVIPVDGEVAFLSGPQFSPDGTRIVFSMGVERAPGADVLGDIYTIGVDGTGLVQLTDTPTDNEYFTDWGVDPS